jgi:LytS/YehU family sensor histidine kinase
MKLKRFDDFTFNFLVNASQMAYLEEAHKTYAMLQKFNELYRYMIRPDNSSMLRDELKALQNFIEIQSLIYENWFKIKLVNRLETCDIYIKHLSILDFVENIIRNAHSEHESFFNLNLELKNENEIVVTAELQEENKKEVYNLTLT